MREVGCNLRSSVIHIVSDIAPIAEKRVTEIGVYTIASLSQICTVQ